MAKFREPMCDEQFAECEAQFNAMCMWIERHIVNFCYRIARVSTELFVFYLISYVLPMSTLTVLMLAYINRDNLIGLAMVALEWIADRIEKKGK